MQSSHIEYLKNLERVSAECHFEDLYLWPRTPLGYDHQDKIVQRVGVSDYDLEGHSRPALIIQQIKVLIKHDLIARDFTILDIACGDGIVLWQIKKAFPKAQCYGIDCNKDKFGTHSMVQRDGVEIFNAFIQPLFTIHPEVPFDLAIMLNTYRGWESADLREHERNLPELADAWFERNARYTILTATDPQIGHLEQIGFKVVRLGKGEDNSTMVCLSKSRLPQSSWQRLLSFH
jgi:hypothetical protein